MAVREVSLEEIRFPLTVTQLLLELGLTVSSSDTKRLIWGTTIMLENSPLNCEMGHIFQEPKDLAGKHLKIGRSKVIKFV